MRQMITGLIAAVAVMAAAPAMACGYTPCAAPVYVPPVVSTCDPCGGYAHERLPDPEQQYYPSQQYYYVNQGPTYTGAGDWAPRPYYNEGYARPYYGHRHYGYGYRHFGYRAYHAYRPYYHRPHYGYGYGHGPYHASPSHYGAPYYYGHRVLRRYY